MRLPQREQLQHEQPLKERRKKQQTLRLQQRKQKSWSWENQHIGLACGLQSNKYCIAQTQTNNGIDVPCIFGQKDNHESREPHKNETKAYVSVEDGQRKMARKQQQEVGWFLSTKRRSWPSSWEGTCDCCWFSAELSSSPRLPPPPCQSAPPPLPLRLAQALLAFGLPRREDTRTKTTSE